MICVRRSNASADVLKPEEVRYNWLEKELLHTVKTEIEKTIEQGNNFTSKMSSIEFFCTNTSQ